MTGSSRADRDLMKAALAEARLALEAGELPIGAVAAVAGRIIARGRASDRQHQNRVSHAETALLMDPGLVGHGRGEITLAVNLEPCPMCMAAICIEGIGRVVYGLRSHLDGGTHLLGVAGFVDACGGHQPELVGGVLADRTSDLMREFAGRPDVPAGMATFAASLAQP